MPKKQLKLILYLNLAHYSSADNLLPPVNKKMTFSSFPYNLMHQDSFAQEDLPDNHFFGCFPMKDLPDHRWSRDSKSKGRLRPGRTL